MYTRDFQGHEAFLVDGTYPVYLTSSFSPLTSNETEQAEFVKVESKLSALSAIYPHFVVWADNCKQPL